MTDDADWVENVKRWYHASALRASSQSDGVATDYGDDLGYEAADPALQAQHWPDAAVLTTDR